MANTWFRLYSEFATDPKVQMMSEAHQRRLVMVFCLRCDETLETLHETEMAFHLRISEEELAQTKALFISKGFIDEHWNLQNWNSRQFISDNSTERVRKYRQGKKQDETLHETFRETRETHETENETAPEQIQNRTDTEQKQRKTESTLALTSSEVPAGVFELPLPGDQGEWQVPQKLFDEMVVLYPAASVMAELAKMRGWLLTNNRKTSKGLPRFINNWLAKTQNQSPRNTGGTAYGKPDKTQHVLDVTERLNERYRVEAERETMGQQPHSGGRTLEAWTSVERTGPGHDGQPVAQDALGDW